RHHVPYLLSPPPPPPATSPLSLHDALPILIGATRLGRPERRCCAASPHGPFRPTVARRDEGRHDQFHRALDPTTAQSYHDVTRPDRKSTRLNSSHVSISYAVFCLKKKNQIA